MENKIALTLSKPYSIVLEDVKVDRVLLPAIAGDITILPQRAPTALLLRNGVLQILDAQGDEIGGYFIKGGVAEVVSNRCLVAAEDYMAFDQVTLSHAEDLLEREEMHLGDKEFYQVIVDYLKFKNR